MQNKSICTKFVALIKKVFGFQHCFKERKLHISEDNIGILPSADIACTASPSQTKTNIDSLPKPLIYKTASYLDVKSFLALLFVNKNIHSMLESFTANAETWKGTHSVDWKERFLDEKYDKNLLKCFVATASDRSDDIKGCIDYETGERFDFSDKSRIRTMWHFTRHFILRNTKIPIETTLGFYDRILSLDKAVTDNYIIVWCGSLGGQFMDMFRAGDFTKADFLIIENKLLNFDSSREQIKNYKEVTGKSYKSIYERIKNNPNPKKPEMENYMNAYEELKKEEGGCDIF